MSIREQIEDIEKSIYESKADAHSFIDELPYEQFGYSRQEAIEEANSYLSQVNWRPYFENETDALYSHFMHEQENIERPETTYGPKSPSSPF